MADKYSTIQQHQPLRVPQGWEKQEKALVVQLDEIFDDIYRRFGRLRMEDMGKAFRKQIEDDEGNIAQLVLDVGQITIEVGNKYDVVSGITINTNGIGLSGSKYIDIASGCYIDIKSGGTIEIESGGGLNIKSGGAIDVKSGGVIDIESGGGINIKSSGAIDIESGGGMNVKSGGNLEVKSGGTFKIVSGGNIDMKASGTLELTGSTVSIKSGSTFDVDSTNFKISSADKSMVCGSWTFNDYGATYLDATNFPFRISEGANTLTNGAGIAFDENSGTWNESKIRLYFKRQSWNATCGVDLVAYETTGSIQVMAAKLIPRASGNSFIDLGEEDNPFSTGWFYSLKTTGAVTIGDSLSVTRSVTAGKGIYGGRRRESGASSNNLNNLKDAGYYSMSASSATNTPTGLSGDFELEVITGRLSADFIIQRIYTPSAIYMRKYDSSWGSWYKFTGTAV